MTTTTDPVCWKSVSEEGLRFFGEMSASVSHEIRNKLAVINEKAGLVQDIALAMKSGRSIDPDRLELQAGKIIEQIRKANQIVGALNRLAHSIDATGIRIDLADLIGLVVELYGRKTAQAEITIDAAVPAGSVSLITSPFLLQDLIGACIDLSIPRVDESRIVTIVAESCPGGAVIRFRHLAGIGESDIDLGGNREGARAILAMLGGRLSADGRRGELVLELTNQDERDVGSQP